MVASFTNSCRTIFFTVVLIYICSFTWNHVESFIVTRRTRTVLWQHQRRTATTLLEATKKKGKKKPTNQKKKGRPSTSGFGGAAIEPCPCGFDEGEEVLPYMKCCGQLHKKFLLEYPKVQDPEHVVRARYTAYAKREIDFIIKTTHPQNKAFMNDIKHWRKQIDMNCYDNFELTKCQIMNETVFDTGDDIKNAKSANVTFVANMIQRDSRERTAFQETSEFEKVGGIWLYKGGVIADPPGREEENVTATITNNVDDDDDDGDEDDDDEEAEDEDVKDSKKE